MKTVFIIICSGGGNFISHYPYKIVFLDKTVAENKIKELEEELKRRKNEYEKISEQIISTSEVTTKEKRDRRILFDKRIELSRNNDPNLLLDGFDMDFHIEELELAEEQNAFCF